MGIVGEVKEIAALIKKIGDQDLYERIVNLRDEIFSLREENLELKEQIKQLKEADEIDHQMKRDGNVYQRHHPEKGELGPYCLACWDDRRKLVSLIITYFDGEPYNFICGFCDKKKMKTTTGGRSIEKPANLVISGSSFINTRDMKLAKCCVRNSLLRKCW